MIEISRIVVEIFYGLFLISIPIFAVSIVQVGVSTKARWIAGIDGVMLFVCLAGFIVTKILTT